MIQNLKLNKTFEKMDGKQADKQAETQANKEKNTTVSKIRSSSAYQDFLSYKPDKSRASAKNAYYQQKK